MWRVEADGTLCEVATSQGSDWALMIRSTVAAALPQTAPNPLDQFSNDDLLAECRRRGINTNT